jgi:SSS family solute:Na+ symporter/sodium/pantothenate symporter
MNGTTFAILLCALYGALTLGLSWLGMRKTADLRSFAVGKGDMSPVLVGVTMASSIASTATFVINPGFVYKDGLSAWAHYGLAAMAGLACALVLLSRGFHKIGARTQAVTLPDWIKKRYDSPALGVGFALLSLLYITFIVLILAGSALIVSQLFDVSYHLSLVGILLFTFSYVLMGGTYAHAYTNAFQGGLMGLISVGVFVVGMSRIGLDFGGALSGVQSAGAHFASWTNPDSSLYYDVFSVFISAFVVTAALMLQPHILTKVLYLKKERDLNRFLVVAVGTSVVFSLMLFIGFFARFDGLAIAAQDKVVIGYVAQTFPPLVTSFVLVTLLAAGMSTLDGILVSISTVVVKDLVLPLRARGRRSDEVSDDDQRRALGWSRYTLVAIGLVSLALAWDPPKLLGLFAQQGVYGLVAASAAPLLLGILRPSFSRPRTVGALALLGVGIHFALKLGADVQNPGVSAAWGILVSVGLGFALARFLPARHMAPAELAMTQRSATIRRAA